MRINRLARWFALLCGIGLGSIAVAPASGDLFFYSYVKYEPSSTGGEPINTLFTENGTFSNTEDHLWHHLSWSHVVCGFTQKFQDHGVWEDMQLQRASGGWCDAVRRHIRHNQQNDAGPSGYGTFTMGASHYEDRPGGCYGGSHRVISFNNARDFIHQQMVTNGGHGFSWIYWGNTNKWDQCDTVDPVSDGNMGRVVIP